MKQEQKRSLFGSLLLKCRRNATDPDRGGALTQERVAELLDIQANLPGYTGVRISNWEKGGTAGEVIRQDNRELLIGLVQVLQACGGIHDLNEANELLEAGDYRALNHTEIQQIEEAWLTEEASASIKMEQGHSVEIKGQRHSFSANAPFAPPAIIPHGAMPVPFMIPALPPQGVFGRDTLLTTIFERMRLHEDEVLNVPPLALRGMGGIGKTTLSIALGRLDIMQHYFPDGILWVALGPNPTPRLALDNWGRALGVDLKPEPHEAGCSDRLREILYSRTVLLIIDDVWDVQHGNYFMVAGPRCRTLITTREVPIAHHLATPTQTLKVDVLSPKDSLALLQKLAPDTVAVDEKSANLLCERLEYLPLALTLAGRLLGDEAEVPSRMQRLVDELLDRREARMQLLQRDGRLGIDEENPVSLQAILGMSVERMDKNYQERFAMSAVLGGEPLTWSLDLAAHIWDCSQEEAEDTVAQFIHRGLVERRENGRYWMHALLVDYAQEMMDELGL